MKLLKIQYMMNYVKKLMMLKLLILVISSKNGYDTNIIEMEKKITDHDHSDKYSTTKEFNKLTAENFAARSKQES